MKIIILSKLKILILNDIFHLKLVFKFTVCIEQEKITGRCQKMKKINFSA